MTAYCLSAHASVIECFFSFQLKGDATHSFDFCGPKGRSPYVGYVFFTASGSVGLACSIQASHRIVVLQWNLVIVRLHPTQMPPMYLIFIVSMYSLHIDISDMHFRFTLLYWFVIFMSVISRYNCNKLLPMPVWWNILHKSISSLASVWACDIHDSSWLRWLQQQWPVDNNTQEDFCACTPSFAWVNASLACNAVRGRLCKLFVANDRCLIGGTETEFFFFQSFELEQSI